MAGRRRGGARLAEQSAAWLNALDWSLPFGHHRNAFPSGLDQRIATRLGAEPAG